MPATEKKIYLTFDDGPIPEITEFVLEQLAVYRAKATFFCIGDNVNKHPAVFKKLTDSQQTIGNHTYNHLRGWNTDDVTYLDNFRACQQVLPPDTTLFRPPYGQFKRSQAQSILQTHQVVMWDVLTGDFSQDLTPETVLAKSLQYTEAGSIVVFHDSLKAARNMMFTLPRFLQYFSEQGYTFEAL